MLVVCCVDFVVGMLDCKTPYYATLLCYILTTYLFFTCVNIAISASMKSVNRKIKNITFFTINQNMCKIFSLPRQLSLIVADPLSFFCLGNLPAHNIT